jgi:hypothetical protein
VYLSIAVRLSAFLLLFGSARRPTARTSPAARRGPGGRG